MELRTYILLNLLKVAEKVKELLSKYRNLGMKRIILDLVITQVVYSSAIQVVSLFLPTDTLIVRIQGMRKTKEEIFDRVLRASF